MRKLFIILSLFAFSLKAIAGTQREEQLSADVQSALHSSIINPIEPHLVFSSKEKADAWMMDMSDRLVRWIPDKFMRERLLTLIQYEAVRAGLDPQMVLSVITVESRFNKYAISPAGAMGLMQVMPFWVASIGTQDQSLLKAETNIRYGCTILRLYLQREQGNWPRALARYNGSLGQSWYSDKIYEAYNKYWTPREYIYISNGVVKKIDYTS